MNAVLFGYVYITTQEPRHSARCWVIRSNHQLHVRDHLTRWSFPPAAANWRPWFNHRFPFSQVSARERHHHSPSSSQPQPSRSTPRGAFDHAGKVLQQSIDLPSTPEYRPQWPASSAGAGRWPKPCGRRGPLSRTKLLLRDPSPPPRAPPSAPTPSSSPRTQRTTGQQNERSSAPSRRPSSTLPTNTSQRPTTCTDTAPG